MASVRIGIHLDESLIDKLEPFIEAAIETGLLTEVEAYRVVIDSLLASLQVIVETKEQPRSASLVESVAGAACRGGLPFL